MWMFVATPGFALGAQINSLYLLSLSFLLFSSLCLRASFFERAGVLCGLWKQHQHQHQHQHQRRFSDRAGTNMVRLTADLILRSPQFFNAVREREIDLRGNKIAVIENLGATEDQFDSIDLSDNEIVKLEGFPYLKRLTTLLVNNNRVARINANIGGFLPKLHTLVLTNNRLVNLGDLDPLAALVNLQTLSLLDNVVTKKMHYRLYVIHKLPKLRLLDFRKVKQRERKEAIALFGSKEAEALKEANTFVPGELPQETPAPEAMEVQQVGPTQEQILAIKAAIASSQTLEEVARLEKALKSGQLPADLKLIDDTSVKKTPSNPSMVPWNDAQTDTTLMDDTAQNGPDSMDQG